MAENDAKPETSSSDTVLREFDGYESMPTISEQRNEVEEVTSDQVEQFDASNAGKHEEINELRPQLDQGTSQLERKRSKTEYRNATSNAALYNTPSGSTSHRRRDSGTTRSSTYSARLSSVPMTKLAVHRVPLSVISEDRSPASPTSGLIKLTTKAALLDIDVKLRLIPVAHILTQTDQTPASRLEARRLAHSTQKFIRECNGSDALLARCSFYIGVTHCDANATTLTQDAMLWLERAVDAGEAGYPEGQWAQVLINRWQSMNLSPTTLGRLGSAASWFTGRVANVWGYVRGSGSSLTPSRPRPKPVRQYSEEENISPMTTKRPTSGERIPSFSTMNNSAEDSVSASETRHPYGSDRVPNSSTNKSNIIGRCSTGTGRAKHHHGVPFSPNSPFGKGKIIPGKQFELVKEPDHVSAIAEGDEEEQQMPNSIVGDFVESANLTPSMQGSPISPLSRRKSYIPPGVSPPASTRVRNIASPLPSPRSTPVSTRISYFPLLEDTSPASPLRSGSQSEGRTHTRKKSVTFDPAIAPTQLTQVSPLIPELGSIRKRRMSSISMPQVITTIATGLDFAGALPHRRHSELAHQMEEGESPGFAPKAHEAALYRRRNSNIIEEV